MPYTTGARIRRVKKIEDEILTRADRYTEVYPKSDDRRKPVALKVKEVVRQGVWH
jgi:hypothetical protein